MVGFVHHYSVCILADINQVRLDTNIDICITSSMPSNFTTEHDRRGESETPANHTDFRLLIGILSLPDNVEWRNLLRLVYGVQPPPASAQVDIKYVFCNLTKEEQKVLMGLEIKHYNDIIILNCPENMNNGKAYTFFSSLPDMRVYNKSVNGSLKPYDYVMKADNGTHFRLGPLVDSLIPFARFDMYYGLVAPCSAVDPFSHYMSGLGYLLQV